MLFFFSVNSLFPQSSGKNGKERFSDITTWVKTYPKHFLFGVEESFFKDDAPYFMISGALSIAALSYFDSEISETKQFMSDDLSFALDKFGDRFGWGYFAGVGFISLESFLSKNNYPEYFSKLEIVLESIALTQIITQGLKLSIGRQRPNKSDEHSFPSGHTSSTFALASAMYGIYGWKVGAPAFISAFLVGAQRINSDAHYLSDVLTGAMIGYLVGKGFSAIHSESNRNNFSPYVFFDKNTTAIKAGFTLNL